MELKDIQNPEQKPIEPATANQSNEQTRKVGVFLGIGIFFMPYIFAWFTLKRGYSSKAKGIAFTWMALILVGAMNRGPANRNSSRGVSSAENVSKDDNKVQFLKDTCLKVSNIFGSSSNLSDLQKEELWKNFKGKSFKWNLSVTEVSGETFGSGFNVQYKCQGSNSLIQDVVVNYPSSAKQVVLGLQKGGSYSVQGTLTSHSTLLGLTAETL